MALFQVCELLYIIYLDTSFINKAFKILTLQDIEEPEPVEQEPPTVELSDEEKKRRD